MEYIYKSAPVVVSPQRQRTIHNIDHDTDLPTSDLGRSVVVRCQVTCPGSWISPLELSIQPQGKYHEIQGFCNLNHHSPGATYGATCYKKFGLEYDKSSQKMIESHKKYT